HAAALAHAVAALRLALEIDDRLGPIAAQTKLASPITRHAAEDVEERSIAVEGGGSVGAVELRLAVRIEGEPFARPPLDFERLGVAQEELQLVRLRLA